MVRQRSTTDDRTELRAIHDKVVSGDVPEKERRLEEALALIDRALASLGVASDDRSRLVQQARNLPRAPALEKKSTKPFHERWPPPRKLVLRFDRRHNDRKLKNLDIIEFLNEVWGERMRARALTRATLRKLDPSADRALQNWLGQKPKRKLPPEIYLPTKKELNDEILALDPLSVISSPRLASVLAGRLRRKKPTNLGSGN